MDANYIQNLRYKLQKRVKKLNSAEFRTFHFALARFWNFLESHPFLSGILDHISIIGKDSEEDAKEIIAGKALHGETENEEVAIAFFVLKECATQDNNTEICIAHNYSHSTNHNEALEIFKEVFVEPLYEFIDEQIDDQRAILALLRKYKQKCEWFQREKLLELYNQSKENRKGEHVLAINLYAYLHDQGLNFSIEPTSASGEADLIAAQNTDDPLIADVKIFDIQKNKGIPYIAKGFHQVYQYTLDYNESFGYMIIFKTCQEDLAISVPEHEQAIPFVIHNNKAIFLLVIDLFAHEKSASQRGYLKSHVVTKDILVEELS